jgi:hypothetical protein
LTIQIRSGILILRIENIQQQQTKEKKMKKINYDDLTKKAQREIDNLKLFKGQKFYVRRRGSNGFLVHALNNDDIDMARAQGHLDDFIKVTWE